MKKCPTLHILVLVVTLLSAQTVCAQVDTGFPPFASFAGGPLGQINLHDLNVHVDFAVTSKEGRGMSAEGGITYDSSVWFPQVVTVNGQSVLQWQPAQGLGWAARMGTGEAGRGLQLTPSYCPYVYQGQTKYLNVLSNYIYWDGNG